MVHCPICIRSVRALCLCIMIGIVNHPECALTLPPVSCSWVQPLMVIDMGQLTLFNTLAHTFTHRSNTGQPHAEPREKLKTASTPAMTNFNLPFWAQRGILKKYWDYFFQRCGCLDSRVLLCRNGVRCFWACLPFACVKGAAVWRSGPWVWEVGRMHPVFQSLWCYCWQRLDFLKTVPAKGQHKLLFRKMKMTTRWATQVLLLLCFATYWKDGHKMLVVTYIYWS